MLFLHGTSGHLEAFTRNIVRARRRPGIAVTPSICSGTATPTSPTTTTRSRATSTTCSATSTRAASTASTSSGESLGGWVSGWLTSEHPERVCTLQLVAAGGTKANPEVMERIKTSTKRAVELDDRDRRGNGSSC